VIRFWREHTGTTIADGYGQTETINIVANCAGLPVKPGSMGRRAPPRPALTFACDRSRFQVYLISTAPGVHGCAACACETGTATPAYDAFGVLRSSLP
jgi:hypothetical protein